MNQHRITQYRVTLSWTVDLDASTEQEAIDKAHVWWEAFGCEHDAASVEQLPEGEQQ
jgi:hypothetical protein